MKNTIMILCCMVFAYKSLLAQQYDSRIQLQLGNFASPQDDERGLGLSKGVINNYGLGIEHKLSSKLGTKISFQKWGRIDKNVNPNGSSEIIFYEGFLKPDKALIGKTLGRLDYNAVDALPTYHTSLNNHDVYAGIGMSYAWGKSIVLKSVYQEPGYND